VTDGPGRPLLTGGAIALLVGMLVIAWTQRARFEVPVAGAPAPEYAAARLNGDTLRLADLHGKVVVLNVWATWCAPCVREMPALQRLYDRLGPEGLEVVAVSVDGTFELASGTVQAFVDDFGLTFAVLHDPTGRIERLFGVNGYPMTIVIDAEGRIRQKVLGERAWDEPEYAGPIEKLLRS